MDTGLKRQNNATKLGNFWGACAIEFDNVLKSFSHLERAGGKEIPDV